MINAVLNVALSIVLVSEPVPPRPDLPASPVISSTVSSGGLWFVHQDGTVSRAVLVRGGWDVTVIRSSG